MTESKPERVRKIKVPRTLPEAWREQELIALLNAASTMRGKFRYWLIDRAKFWRAFILLTWDSGLRLGDVWRIGREQIGSDGSLVVTQSKTLWPLLCHLRPETVAAIDATFPPVREQIFGSVLCKRQAIEYFAEIVKHAGLSGGTKKIRKSGASAMEAETPGTAMGYLGHKTPGLAYKFYVDPRISQQKKSLPPPIAG